MIQPAATVCARRAEGISGPCMTEPFCPAFQDVGPMIEGQVDADAARLLGQVGHERVGRALHGAEPRGASRAKKICGGGDRGTAAGLTYAHARV